MTAPDILGLSVEELTEAFATNFGEATGDDLTDISDYQSLIHSFERFLDEGLVFHQTYHGPIADESLRAFDTETTIFALKKGMSKRLPANTFPRFAFIRNVLENMYGQGPVFIKLISKLLTELRGDLEVAKQLAAGKTEPSEDFLQDYVTVKSEEVAPAPLIGFIDVEPHLERLVLKALKDGERLEDWFYVAAMEKLLRDGVIKSSFKEGPPKTAGSHRKLRHVRRTRDALPDSNRPAGAEVNRRSKQISLRISPSLLTMIDHAVASEDGADRTAWLRAAMTAFIQSSDPLPESDMASEPVSEIVMLRFEPDFIEQIDLAASAAGTTRADWMRRVAAWQLNRAPLPSRLALR